jgi:DNA polymerase III subunit epsilon
MAVPLAPELAAEAITADPALVRQWARTNGYEVGDRGRLPREILDAYNSTDQPCPVIPERG